MDHFEGYLLYHLLIYSKVSCPYDFWGESQLKGQGNVGDNSQSALPVSIEWENSGAASGPYMKTKSVKSQL